MTDNQPAKYQVSAPVQPTVNQPDAEPAKTPVKRLIRKTGSGFTPSIKDALSGKLTEDSPAGDAREKMKYYTGEEMNEPFTKEAFEATWTDYLNRLQDRPGLKATLSRLPEILEGSRLKLTIDNSVQLEEIAKIKPDLVSWLRRELKNTTIELVSEIAAREVDTKPYTETEKLAEMVKKNPSLALLRQRFNLDFGEI
ncbi:MAG: hypothetical protein AAGU19_11895 [Prolixibacteraceae bacterium]